MLDTDAGRGWKRRLLSERERPRRVRESPYARQPAVLSLPAFVPDRPLTVVSRFVG
ncbi:hypothetical protein AB0I69_14985 [Streptomyces sp. NPDC050508]|uniref:hypothetical protein n=1 Tax=Streptomyces sp. NPDC050508 TaxID=3155405 RepID=UPI003422595F